MLAKKIKIISGAEIKKEKIDNNIVYAKFTKYQAYRWLASSFFRNKFDIYDNGKDITLSLQLPEFKNKNLYKELVKEPVWNTIIDLLINISNSIFQDKVNATKRIKALEVLNDISEYQQVILEQDKKINELELIIKNIKGN